MIIGFDPGRDKCGVAVMNQHREILYHEVINSQDAILIVNNLIVQYNPEMIVMGNQTTSKQWRQKLTTNLDVALDVELVNEKNSTLEAKERYWQMYPPKGLNKLIPKGMRVPPRPVDDIVAILLIERYLQNK